MFLKFEKFTTIYLSISHSRYEKRVKSRSRQKRVKSDLKWPSRCKNGLGRFAKIFPPSRIFYRSVNINAGKNIAKKMRSLVRTLYTMNCQHIKAPKV